MLIKVFCTQRLVKRDVHPANLMRPQRVALHMWPYYDAQRHVWHTRRVTNWVPGVSRVPWPGLR